MDLREKAGCWSGCDGCLSCTVSDIRVNEGTIVYDATGIISKTGVWPDTTVQPREGDALPPEEDACACGCKVCSEAKVNP